jgi:predicted Zn-dependent peptidase
MREQVVPYMINAPVQADKTGLAIKALMDHVASFVATKGLTDVELARVINGNTRQLAGQFETSQAVLGALRSNALYKRPDNYWEAIADRYRGMTISTVDEAARKVIDPKKIVWVVVGDAEKVRPQLADLGLPVEEVQPK